MRTVALLLVAIGVLGVSIVGCSSSEFDENYKTEVKLTEEQKQRIAIESKRYPMPGTAKR